MMESSAPPEPPAEYLPVANWRVRDVVYVFLAGLAGSAAVTVVVIALGLDPLAPVPFSLIFVGQFAGSFAVVMALSRIRGSGSLAADVGLVLRGSDWWGVPAGMALQIAIALVTSPLIYLIYGDDPPEQAVADVAAGSKSVAEQLLIALSVAVLAPIIEEIIFRGMLLNVLRKHWGAWLSIVVSAAVFASVHLLDPGAIAVVPGLFLLGLVLGWAALRRGDLSLAAALHSGINLIAVIAILWGDQILDWSQRQIEELEGLIHLLPF